MSKVAVVYWSSTGNTQAMAEAVCSAVNDNGGQGVLLRCDEFDGSMMDDFDAVIFGCPSMGAEVLEESEFQPMFDTCLDKLKGKKIGLFGSYGWGDGQWMRDWDSQCKSLGAVMPHKYVICCEAMDDTALQNCQSLAKAMI